MRHRIIARVTILVLSLVVLCSGQLRAQSLYVIPYQGYQGETLTLRITAVGDTFFYPWDVQFYPSDGIEVGDISFDSGTNHSNVYQFNVSISLADDATPGTRTITVFDRPTVDDYYGKHVAAEAFEVLCTTCGAIASVYPSSGMVGTSLDDVRITGSNTHFVDGSSVLSFSGSGIQVSNILVYEDTVITAHLTISASASPGKRDVTVTTGPEVATGSDLFEVTQLPPVKISPDSGVQGDPLSDFTITDGPGGYSLSTQVNLGDDITTEVIDVSGDGSTLTISASIDINAAIGPRDLVLTTGSETVTGDQAFTVFLGAATIINSITPNAADSGHPGFPVIVTGTHVRFDTVPARLNLNGINAHGINVQMYNSDPNQIEALLSIADNTATGSYDVIVQLCPANQDCQTVTSTGVLFNVTEPGVITLTDPNTPVVINAGDTATLNLSVSNCPLDPTPTIQVEPPEGVTIGTPTVLDATHLTVTVTVGAAAFGNERNLRLINGPEIAIGTEIFKIHNPQIVGVDPTRGRQNTPALNLTVTGNDLPFDAQSTIAVSGDGVTVKDIVFDSQKPNQLSCTLAIAADATLGQRDITVEADYTRTAEKIFSVVSSTDPYKRPSSDCSCSATQADPLSLGWLVLPLVILRRLRKRLALVR